MQKLGLMALPAGAARTSLAALLALVASGCGSAADGGSDAGPSPATAAAAGYVLDHRLEDIDGNDVDLTRFGGQVLMLVNVASRCGYTPQYEGLEALYERYRRRGFAVLGFPSNDFGGQEPGTNAEIKQFCRATWGVEFPMFAKLSVLGPEQHPLYAELAGLAPPLGGEVAWNFQKYLVDRRGVVRAKFPSRTAPDDPRLIEQLEALIDEDA